MKPINFKVIDTRLHKLKDLRNNTKISIFLICLLISIFIWFLIKMSKDYSSDISYQINFYNPPSDQIITEARDSVIFLQINSRGFELLNRIYFKNTKPINIDLSRTSIHKERYTMGSYILSESLLSQIRNQYEFSDEIGRISPDTLYLKLENTISKEVDIQLNLEINPKQQHYIYGNVTQSHLKVEINGPPTIIDKIKNIETEQIELHNIDADQHLLIPLINPYSNNNVKFSIDTIKIDIPIENFTESSLSIPIEIRNQSELNIKLFPETISVKYLVALRDFDRVSPDMFSAYINYDPSFKNYQTIIFSRHPDFVRLVDFSPKSVEYLILMNND